MGKIVTITFKDQASAKEYLKSVNAHQEYWESHNGIISVEEDWHTPHELYQHRYELFRALCFGMHRLRSWRAQAHADGSMFKDSFIVGMNLPTGMITYHYPLSWWDKFGGITTYIFAPEWDGADSDECMRRLAKAVDAIRTN